jgi:CBS domain-containing protein
MKVADILQHKGGHTVITAAEQSIKDTVALLHREKIGAVVVCDVEGRAVGLISERDIVNGLADRGAHILELKVGDLMKTSITSCKTDDNIVDLMATMTERRIRHIPVIENDKLKGIVSIGDVVKNRIAETEHEAELLREYISSG